MFDKLEDLLIRFVTDHFQSSKNTGRSGSYNNYVIFHEFSPCIFLAGPDGPHISIP